MEKCQFCSNTFGDTKMLRQHQKKTKYCLKIQKDKEDLETKQKKEAEELAKSSELICKFCNKQFKTKYLLNIHQTQTKYCLKIQESQNSKEIIAALVTCKFCNKNFSASHFNRHDLTCKKKIQSLTQEITMIKTEKDQEIAMMKLKAEKDQEIAILKLKGEKDEEISLIYKASAELAQATINEIAKQPTYQKNSTKNIQNNLMISSLTPLDLTQARVDSIINEKYTKSDFYEGQKGAAQIIHKHILTDSNGKSQIVCTDTERGTFHHIDTNGEHVVDYKNSHLINRVHLPLKRKASKFAAEESVKNSNSFKDIIMNETSIRELESKPGLFNRTLAQLTSKNCVRPLCIEPFQKTDLSITEEWLLENAKFLTIEHILKGPEGYADYALSYPLNNRLIEDEDDYSFVKYRDIDGCIVTDYGCKILSEMILNSLKQRMDELIKSTDKLNDTLIDINDCNFKNEFITILMNNI